MRPLFANHATSNRGRLRTAFASLGLTAALGTTAGCGSDEAPAAQPTTVDAGSDTQTGCNLPGSSGATGPAVANEDLSISVQYLGGS